MNEVIYLIETKSGNDSSECLINTFTRGVNQIFFSSIKEALYYLFINYNSFKVTKSNSSNNCMMVVADNKDKKSQFLLKIDQIFG